MILGENSPQDKITMFHNRKAMIGFKAGNKNKLTDRNVVVVHQINFMNTDKLT